MRGLTTASWKKPKFKFEFNDGYEFHYAPDQEPVEEFNLQSHYLETGAVSYMGETLAFEWLREIGVPAPFAFPMHVRQNGQFYSLASFVEQIDETFLVRNGFDPNGSMYKANSGAVMSTLKPNPTPADYLKATRKDEPFDDLIELTAGINNRIDGIDRSTYLFDVINLPEVINDMAGNVIMPNHDRLTKNYYMYRDVNGNNEWSRFPVGYGSGICPLYRGSFRQRACTAIPSTRSRRTRFIRIICTMRFWIRRPREKCTCGASGPWSTSIWPPATLSDKSITTTNDSRPDAARDNAKWQAGDIRNGVERIKSNLAFRRQQLEAEGLLPPGGDTVDHVTLLPEDATVAVFVPQDESLANRWTGSAEPFDEMGWQQGRSGVGFDNGRNPIYAPEIDTQIEPQTVCDACTSIYARFLFEVEDPSPFNVLTLQVKYDDGFVAYLNGQQVWRENVTGDVSWNSVASSSSPKQRTLPTSISRRFCLCSDRARTSWRSTR